MKYALQPVNTKTSIICFLWFPVRNRRIEAVVIKKEMECQPVRKIKILAHADSANNANEDDCLSDCVDQ